MSEEADVDTGWMIVEDKQMNEEREDKGSQEKSSPLGKCSTVIMTDEESMRESTADKEIERGDQGLVNLVALH